MAVNSPSQGKVVLLTGAAKRLGAATARGLSQSGWRVVINFRSSRVEAEATVRALVEDGGDAIALQADVSNAGEVERMLAQTVDHFGRLDALIANASTFHRTPFATLTAEQWHEAIDNNLDAAALPAIACGRWMKNNGGGCIVAIADVAGFQLWRDYLPYSVAKAGVIALTRGLARELAPEIRVNAIAPGPMLFPDDMPDDARDREIARTLLKRAGTPEHIAAAVRFLLEHDYITGAVLPIDGGRGLA